MRKSEKAKKKINKNVFVTIQAYGRWRYTAAIWRQHSNVSKMKSRKKPHIHESRPTLHSAALHCLRRVTVSCDINSRRQMLAWASFPSYIIIISNRFMYFHYTNSYDGYGMNAFEFIFADTRPHQYSIRFCGVFVNFFAAFSLFCQFFGIVSLILISLAKYSYPCGENKESVNWS